MTARLLGWTWHAGLHEKESMEGGELLVLRRKDEVSQQSLKVTKLPHRLVASSHFRNSFPRVQDNSLHTEKRDADTTHPLRPLGLYGFCFEVIATERRGGQQQRAGRVVSPSRTVECGGEGTARLTLVLLRERARWLVGGSVCTATVPRLVVVTWCDVSVIAVCDAAKRPMRTHVFRYNSLLGFYSTHYDPLLCCELHFTLLAVLGIRVTVRLRHLTSETGELYDRPPIVTRETADITAGDTLQAVTVYRLSIDRCPPTVPLSPTSLCRDGDGAMSTTDVDLGSDGTARSGRMIAAAVGVLIKDALSGPQHPQLQPERKRSQLW
ncbi:hypothetical protein J6590_030509 [Homalodisca vitripennis]|nr:hypothetical protein J6590_030509 [Homalodisca vitripennis]